MNEGGTLRLYNAFATSYDEAFESDRVRASYDQLAWEVARLILPQPPGVVVDAGSGTGRWVARLLDAGYQVIAIEPASGMQQILQQRFAGRDDVEIRQNSFDDASIESGSIDAVVAMGSVQYAPDPAASLVHMANWVRPGGVVCVHVDSLLGVVLELIRLGRTEEAIQRAQDGSGIFTLGEEAARLQLFDRVTLKAALEDAGLIGVDVRGLLIGASALGRAAISARLEASGLNDERQLMAVPALADAGKHLIAWGRRP